MKPTTLSRSADFRRAYGEGTRARRDGLGVAAVDRADDAPARVGLAVKKSAGSSVRRNRIKRRLRAALASIELSPGFDIVVSADGDVATAEFQILVTHLRAALESVGATR